MASARIASSPPESVGTLAGGVPGPGVAVGLGDAVAVEVGVAVAVEVGVGVGVAVGVGVGPWAPTVIPVIGVCIERLATRVAAPVERLIV